MPKKKPKATGPARMKQLDKAAVQIWFKQADFDKLKRMAEKEQVPMATLCRSAILFNIRNVDV